jgi:integrase
LRINVHKHFLNESVRLSKEGKDNYQVNADIKMIRALFNYAINELEIMDYNPTKKIKLYPVIKKLKYIPPDQDINLVYSLANASQKKLILFAKESACRIGEAIRDVGNDIDLDMDPDFMDAEKEKQ